MKWNLAIALLLPAALSMTGCMRPEPDTSLTIAVEGGELDTVRTLLAQGAAPDTPDRHGLTALVRATRGGNLDIVSALLAAGASPNQNDGFVNGWTPMMHAIHKSQPKVVDLLIEAGADVNGRAPNGCTALMFAAGEGQLDVVKVLLDKGADPRAETLEHTTALTNAVAGGHTEIVRLLMTRAPDLKLKGILEDRVALMLTWVRGRRAIRGLLNEAGATP